MVTEQVEEKAEREPRPIQKHWVGVDTWMENVQLPDGSIHFQLYRKGTDGPTPLLVESLDLMDFDPNRVRSALRKGQDAATAAFGSPKKQSKRPPRPPREKKPLTQNLREKVEAAVVDTPQPKRRRRRKKRPVDPTYWWKRWAAIWER